MHLRSRAFLNLGTEDLPKIRLLRWDGFWQITNSYPKTLHPRIFMPLFLFHILNGYDLVTPNSVEVSSDDIRIEMRTGMSGIRRMDQSSLLRLPCAAGLFNMHDQVAGIEKAGDPNPRINMRDE